MCAAESQATRYAKGIGRGLSTNALSKICAFAEDMIPRKFFIDHPQNLFWYERQAKPNAGTSDSPAVGDVADLWTTDQANIERAASSVGRPSTIADKRLVHAFAIVRFKAREGDNWGVVKRPATDDPFKQTLVCIALEDLSTENGFFMTLNKGEDVCIDGETPLLLPSTGGGLAILIWMRL